MADQDVREQVRERYAAAATAVSSAGALALTVLDGDGQACCAPAEGVVAANASCCGGGAEVDASFGQGLYSAAEQGELPAEAVLASLGCGNPVAVAELHEGERVLDLGSAPGGWSQVAAGRGATVVAADVLAMEEVTGVTFFQADLTDPEVPAMLKKALGGPADLVLTDMAAPTTGHRATDHLRTIALVEIALEVALEVLKPAGVFVGKVFQGGATGDLLARMKMHFREVRHVKPPASRAESVELYVVALGFKGKEPRGRE